MKKTQKYTLIVILVLIIAAGIIFIVQMRHSRQGTFITPKATQNQNQAQPVYAAKGQLTSGLSKDMILASKPTVDTSYSVSMFNNSATQNAAIFTTSDSVKTVYDAYLKYLKANKYYIVNSSLTAKQGVLYGYTDQGSLSVQIDPTKTGSSVIISYLKNSK